MNAVQLLPSASVRALTWAVAFASLVATVSAQACVGSTQTIGNTQYCCPPVYENDAATTCGYSLDDTTQTVVFSCTYSDATTDATTFMFPPTVTDLQVTVAGAPGTLSTDPNDDYVVGAGAVLAGSLSASQFTGSTAYILGANGDGGNGGTIINGQPANGQDGECTVDVGDYGEGGTQTAPGASKTDEFGGGFGAAGVGSTGGSTGDAQCTILSTATQAPQVRRALRQRRMQTYLQENPVCPHTQRACPLPSGNFECIDFDELTSCGGCVSTGTGVDCLALEGNGGVGCISGECRACCLEERKAMKSTMRRSTPTPPTDPTPSERTPLRRKTSTPSTSNTILLEDLAPWRHDNEYILTGYRRELPSYVDCIKSVWSYWHNETVNIVTHAFGSVVALVIAAVIYFSVDGQAKLERRGWLGPFRLVNPFPSGAQPTVTWSDTLGWAIFFASAATCLGFSASFHCVSCHSMTVAHMYNKLDYIGIVVLISGTFVPLIHYGFFCAPNLHKLYLTMIILASLATVATVITPHAKTPEYRRFRTFVFIALGGSAVFPVFHGVATYGFTAASDAFALPWVVLGGALYIAGALIYVERIPERFFPKTFDIIGSSHQIFHVMILLAAWSHYTAIAESFAFWHGEQAGQCTGYL
ncbi:hemolysin-III channel protein Izh2 [Pseudohyphozyma bogoriensis]|nr:hemolysin-III channel protein Izh2 [Pseudohyphozyma bogoriensis]